MNGSLQNYFKTIRTIKLLTPTEEKELAKAAMAGDKSAKDRLINANLRLVITAANRYSANTSLSFEDLVQEGNIGLMFAVDKFDPSYDCRFSTYAMYWIKQSISRAILNHSHTIRLPIHVLELKNKYKKSQQKLQSVSGKEPTAEEIAADLRISVKKVTEIQNLIKDPISLYTTLGDDEEGTLEDLVADPDTEDFDELADQTRLEQTLDQILGTLSQREQDILTARYGLKGGVPQTLEQLGKKYGLTKERIRQIEQMALRKLRNPMRADVLKPYLV